MTAGLLICMAGSGSAQMCPSGGPAWGHYCYCPWGTNHLGQKQYLAQCGEACSCRQDSETAPPVQSHRATLPTTAPAPPKLGVNIETDSTDGALLSGIISKSPADSAGLAKGDVVLELNGHPIRTGQQLYDEIQSIPRGSQVTLVLRRREIVFVLTDEVPPPKYKLLEKTIVLN